MKRVCNAITAWNDKPQIDRVRETARALDCDEDEVAFKAKLAMIARH